MVMARPTAPKVLGLMACIQNKPPDPQDRRAIQPIRCTRPLTLPGLAQWQTQLEKLLGNLTLPLTRIELAVQTTRALLRSTAALPSDRLRRPPTAPWLRLIIRNVRHPSEVILTCWTSASLWQGRWMTVAHCRREVYAS